MSEPAPRTTVSERFRQQLAGLQAYARLAATAEKNWGASLWYRPEGLDAGLLDIEALSKPFQRDEQADAFLKVASKENPGTAGDLAMLSLQGDFLASLERAFRARHSTSVRRRLHAAGRLEGHAAETGVLAGGLLRYIEDIDAVQKGQ